MNMDHPDRVEKIADLLKLRKLSNPFRDIVKSAYGYSLYLSYKYLSYSARKSIGNDGQNCMFYENMLKYMSSSDENSSDDNENLLMITTDSKKVFIGSVFRMPEQNLFEQDGTLGIVPFMSGYLCDSCLQLHITTDYTKILEDINAGKIRTDKSMIAFLPVKNIYYTRDFDISIFSNNFRRKVCACGEYVDNTQGFKSVKYSPLVGRSKELPK